MNLEIVTIGTELLLGFTIDTNGAELGRQLAAVGVRVVRRTSVADDPEQIRDAVGAALRRTGTVITTGGLGPTRDDITKAVVAEMFGRPLDFNAALWEALVARYRKRGREPSPSNRTQAEVPRGAVVLPNPWGSASGLWLEGDPGLVIMLPGVPSEMRNLASHEVVPRLRDRSGVRRVVRSRTVRLTGVPESSLADRLGKIEPEIAPLTLAYLPGIDGVDLRLTAWDLPAEDADVRLARAVERVRTDAPEWIYGVDEEDLASVVVGAARHSGARIAVAESCTGGLLGGRLTDVPGSSAAFAGGVIAYDNAAKTSLLGVSAELIEREGAVSEGVALAMAAGARAALGTDIGVSLTGVAGPDGGTDAKPVGTVWIGLVGRGAPVVRQSIFTGDRGEIRARAVQSALFLLWQHLRLSFDPQRSSEQARDG